MPTKRSMSFLRLALLGDGVASEATGLAMIAGAGLLEGVLGLPESLLRYAGLFLVPYAIVVAFVGTRERIARGAVLAIVAVNLLWVVESPCPPRRRLGGADRARHRLRAVPGGRGGELCGGAVARPAPRRGPFAGLNHSGRPT